MPSFLSVSVKNSSSVKYIYGTISRNSSRVCVQRPANTGFFKKLYKKNGGHPDIFRPQHDCGWCGGGGCGHCS